MFLKQLELVGFKSFPEKTRLKFERGITAIVGPNGCGKSNIFDGIRWVLGEQSTKALRSMKMEDIIFNGTDKKPSLGMAEATLTFSNESRKLTIDYDEIEVCRRVFRSGESQYLLNKTPVRLKDIADLFLGTGIGAESYSLVEQGKIDLILSSRPEERRLIFDEASGITKYKAQKKEALRKLEETEQNLLRINDIITEVKREINSLERQANKARRYKEFFEELKDKERNLASLEINGIEQQKQDLLNKINVSEENISSYDTQILGVQEEISLRLKRIQQLEQEISQQHDRLLNINHLINNNNQRMQMNQERQSELSSRITDLKGQLEAAKTRIQTSKDNLERFQEEYNQLKSGVKQKEVLLSEKQKKHQETESWIESSLREIKLAKSRILDFVAASTQVKNEITDLRAYLKSQALREKRLDIERAKSKEEKENLEQLLNQQTEQRDVMHDQLKQIKDAQDQFKEKLTQQLNAQARLSQDIQNLENEKIALQSQKEFLEELRLKYEGIKQSLNAVLYLDRSPGDDISGIVFRVKEPASLIKKEAGNYPTNLKFKLSGEAKPMPLETQTITQRIEQIQSEIKHKQQDQQSMQRAIQELNQRLKDFEQRAKAQEIIISNKNLQIDNLTEQLNKINQEYEVVNLELEDLASQINELNQKQGKLEVRLSETEEQQKSQEEIIIRLEESVAELRSLREQLLMDITQIKTDIENQLLRLSQQEETQSLLENTYTQSQQLYQGYLDESQQSEARIKQLSNKIKQLSQENLKAEDERTELGKQQNKQQTEFKQLSELQEQANHKIFLFSQSIEEIRKLVHELQMEKKELDFKQQSIHDRINQIYKIDLAGDNSVIQVPEDKSALTARISELKEKLDSLGTVNLIAIEEYEELKKRYDFLIQQQNDLLQAKQSLNQAIIKINRTTRQMFLDTFKMIQDEFRNYFRLLFGGGQAQVMLIDESDPLESGIEIICRPPGKKLQNVLALSGGEKSLAAVALMFAVFKVKPAPFCVLDEIDAALDEANIDRFSGILQEFAKDSQFLVITHNKKTIANADVMYGITMQESGISNIVSVKLT
ncbi:MAG: AAA family ATPase [Candidatus Omnitrophota bacterium]|jgi:chromosome segregation protein